MDTRNNIKELIHTLKISTNPHRTSTNQTSNNSTITNSNISNITLHRSRWKRPKGKADRTSWARFQQTTGRRRWIWRTIQWIVPSLVEPNRAVSSESITKALHLPITTCLKLIHSTSNLLRTLQFEIQTCVPSRVEMKGKNHCELAVMAGKTEVKRLKKS